MQALPTSMNCISWNCCGLGQSRAILELTELVQKYSPSIIFLMETRSKESFLKKLCSKLHIENVFIVPRTNTRGGGVVSLFIGGMVLKHICLKMDLPWLCVRDFNENFKAEEKMGGAIRRER